MFGAFIFLLFPLAFGGTVNNHCQANDLNFKQCVEWVESTAVYEYPTKK